MTDRDFRFYTIEPKDMETIRRLFLAKKVYQNAHRKVFKGVTFREFYFAVFAPDTIQTKIRLYFYKEKIIGYSTFQLYQIKKSKLQFYVAMSEMCLKKTKHIHQIHPIDFFIKESAKFIFSNPFSKTFMIDTLISPIIYNKICHTTFEMYPTYNKKIPSKLTQLCRIVAKIFHWKFQSTGQFIVRKLNWKVKNKYLLNETTEDPNTDYYYSILPDFHLGKGLVVVIPITVFNITASIIKTTFYLLSKRWRKH